MKKTIFKRCHLGFFLFVFTVFCACLAPRGALPASGENQKTIVIDAGHGAPDGGAVGSSGVPESEINLEISRLLCKDLEERGYKVLMTRTDENGIYKNENASIREKKREDMKERLSIANKSRADLFISIHMNYFADSNSAGPQVFYKAGSPDGERAASHIREAFLKNIGKHCAREIKPVTDGIYLLREIKIPAVLVECGFLSNAEEEKLLLSPDYQAKMAKAISDGTDKYFSN